MLVPLMFFGTFRIRIYRVCSPECDSATITSCVVPLVIWSRVAGRLHILMSSGCCFAVFCFVLFTFLIYRMDDGSQRMYYTGQGVDGSTAIGVARLDIDSTSWVREQATITFADM